MTRARKATKRGQAEAATTRDTIVASTTGGMERDVDDALPVAADLDGIAALGTQIPAVVEPQGLIAPRRYGLQKFIKPAVIHWQRGM